MGPTEQKFQIDLEVELTKEIVRFFTSERANFYTWKKSENSTICKNNEKLVKF